MADYPELAKRFQKTLGMKNTPVAMFYADEKPAGALGFKGVSRGSCIIALCYQASLGKIAAFDAENHGCPGAGRYLGFTRGVMPHFAEFLSCGIEGVVEGERYIKTPELAQVKIDRQQIRPAPAEYCIFYPLDQLPDSIEPEIITFFVPPDLISALVVLSDYDNEREDSNTVVRFASGCGQIVNEPLKELGSDDPRAVLGMFDVSARPRVPREVFSYAMPAPLFVRMAGNIEGSFLQNEEWLQVRARNQND